MAAHKLIPYWIQIRESNNADSNWDQTRLREFESGFPYNNLTDYFEDFLNQYSKETYLDFERQKIFNVAEYRRDGNTIEGRFKGGEWGRNADFYDVEEETRYEDRREESHAEEIPFYFLFHIPDRDSSQALLILSKYKRKGVKTTFKSLFDPAIREGGVGDAHMTINPHFSDRAAEKIDEADKIASVKFRGQDTVPAREEYASRQNIQRVHDDISGMLEVNMEAKLTPDDNREGFRGLVRGLLPDGDNDAFEYGQFTQENFSKATVTVVEGESQLSFPLWEDEIQMRMDLDPDDHDLNLHGGYPTPHSVGRVARQLANDLMRDLNTPLDQMSLLSPDIGTSEQGEDEAVPFQD